ncbi:hypothetical protein E4O03_07020 [Treponema sp. OMZ 792]|uniref:hypothetical protein n=1 Tax=unclassified Treponema TaxID=2638727 RepID=UPI0021FC3B93|nr:hypothetical protein E4O03_07020 [Treponema sp. OMZ 792]UTC81615.1 hypothetical protein E4O07_06920 [Treponema sp. OMZ 798]
MLKCRTMFDRLETLLPEINLFLKNVGEAFTLEDLKNFIGLKNFDDSNLGVFLISLSLAYFFPDPDSDSGVWISKHGFFTGKKFSVQISDTEDEMKIFIPGSRFLPFLPADKYAHEAKLFYEGKEIPKRRVYLSFDRLSSFYFLYTESDLSNVLCEDYEENVETFSGLHDSFNPEARFAVSAWDFSAVFDKCNFNYPMRLFVHIKDWSGAEFEILKERHEFLEENISNWFDLFEAAVRSSLKILPMESTTQDILSFAYFLGEDALFNENSAPMELFFERKDVFGVIPYGIEEKFWVLDEPIAVPANWFYYPYNETKEDNFFNSINRPVTEAVIDCFVLDFLSSNYMARFDDEVKGLFIKESLDLFIPEFMNNHKTLSSKCKTYLEMHYDYWVNLYNPFKDDGSKDLRSDLVDFYKNLIVFFNELDERKLKTSDFDGQSALMICQIFDKVFQWTEFVSSIEAEDYNFIEVISMSLENLSYVYTDVKVEIINKLSALTKT